MRDTTAMRALAAAGFAITLIAGAWAWDAHPWVYEAVGLRERSSIWTSTAGDWCGNLVWSDTHMWFEQCGRGFTTRYQAAVTTNDNLFQSSNGPTCTEAAR